MESAPFNEDMERLITDEEKERLQRALASYGLVDATLFELVPQKNHEDIRWAVDVDINPSIILGNN